jgi:hypothetical protein
MIKAAKLQDFVFACTKDDAERLAAIKYPTINFQVLRYQI